MRDQCTEAVFLKDVERHELIVLRDDGLYRHIRFKRPGTGCMHFDLVTWPGYLAYAGDMGCYVFSRLQDMFEFFRKEPREGRSLFSGIDRRYWSEKLPAVDGNRRIAGAMEFSKDKFTAVINEYRVRWMKERTLNKDQRRELWEAVDDEVLRYLEDGEHAAYQRANEFTWVDGAAARLPGCAPETFHFDDLWDHSFEEYTFHFTWCCYALAWGIRQYDAAKAGPDSQESHATSHAAGPDQHT
jgi:hypothetical protein